VKRERNFEAEEKIVTVERRGETRRKEEGD
jgi:hypothetical protein